MQQQRNDRIEDSRDRNYFDLFSMIVPMLRDFFPILIERWSGLSEKPSLRVLEEENRRLQEKVEQLERKVLWLTVFQIVTGVFFLFFILLIAFRVI